MGRWVRLQVSSWKGEWNCTIEWFVCQSFLNHLRPTRVYLNKITLDASFSRVTHSGDHSPTLRLPNSPSRQLVSSRPRSCICMYMHSLALQLPSARTHPVSHSPSTSLSHSLPLSLLNSLVSLLTHSPTLLLCYFPSNVPYTRIRKMSTVVSLVFLSFFCIVHPDFGEDLR
jgi:hypothetical protein